MKKRTGIFRLLSFLLTLIMFASMPLSAFAAEATDEDIPIEDMVLPDPPDEYVDEVEQYSIMLLAYDYDDIPEEMLDNSILRALAYTGFDVQYLKDKKVLYNTSYIGSALKNNAPDVLSGIPYSHDGSGSGLQTVKDSSTPTGLAPNIAYFKETTGLDCADFCAYYLCNYLPNIEGIDTSIFQDYRKELGYRPDDMRFWMAACADMDEKGLCDAYYLTTDDSRNNTEAYQEAIANCRPGDLIRMGTETKDWVHYAIYAGTYNGEHYLIHVANDRGPEISLIRYQDNPSSSKWSVPLAFYHFYWNDTEDDGIIEVNKSDDNGTALAGAEFTATNNETGEKYVIGPTDSKGYAKADKIPYGTYTVVESKFPPGYQSSGTSTWTVTLDKNTPNGTVTINATNKLITGDLKLIKDTNTDGSLGGWDIGVYTDSACTQPVSGSPFTTGADGTITVQDLLPGTYYCKEILIDDPYWVCDTSVKTVTVEGNKTASVTFENTHYGDLRVKKNAVNGSSEGWNFQILDSSKNLLYTITTGADGYAASPMLLPGTYYIREVHDRDDTYWTYDATLEKQVTVTVGTQAQVSYTNIQYGRMEFRKTTNTGNDLAGWTFRVKDVDGNLIGDYTTDDTGYVCTGKLAPGRYFVTELSNNDPYWVCDLTTHTVDVTAGKTVGSSWTNTNLGLGVFQKITNTGENQEGWYITVYSDAACTMEVTTITTGADGSTSCYLEPGIYYAKESGDKYGRFNDSNWTIDTSVKEFTISAGQNAEVTFSNTHYVRIQIIKTLDTDGTLAGWLFKISDANGNEIEGSPFTSQADGTILTGKLAPGQYTVEELIPENSLFYCKTENPQTITVTAGETAVVTFTNALRPGTISVQKTDIHGQPLAGAKFILEWSEDGIVWTAVTQSSQADVSKGCSADAGTQVSPEDGIIEWTNLYPGVHYRITELEAPEGYSLLTGPAFEGQLPVDDLTVTLRVVNAQTFMLPETGSYSPTLMPIALALCLVACAGALLCMRKKEQ